MAEFRFPTQLEKVKEASSAVLGELKDMSLDKDTLFDIKLCFEEAFINAVKYGNNMDPELSVDVTVEKDPDGIEISLRDYGEENDFDLESIPDPTTEENLKKTSGRGVYLIKKLMDEVRYDNDRHQLIMKKKISQK